MPSLSELRHSLAVANPGRVSDGDGGYTETFVALTPATIWGAVEPATAANIERAVGATVDAKVTHLVTVRYHAGITTQTRIMHKTTRALFVRGIQNVRERGEWLVLACEEVV